VREDSHGLVDKENTTPAGNQSSIAKPLIIYLVLEVVMACNKIYLSYLFLCLLVQRLEDTMLACESTKFHKLWFRYSKVDGGRDSYADT
jgi:hypothetical protein